MNKYKQIYNKFIKKALVLSTDGGILRTAEKHSGHNEGYFSL